jgi:mannose/fructose-specific phosphotransferase system component IIA
MSETVPVQGIVLAHGEMASGLADAVARISGAEREVLLAVSNSGKSPEILQAELAGILARGPTIIFADLPSGSCALTARLCCGEDPEAAVIFGVNLPILLDFVFHRHLPLTELVPRLLEKGRGGISSAPDFSINGDPALSR